jgi:hypothetical protein
VDFIKKKKGDFQAFGIVGPRWWIRFIQLGCYIEIALGLMSLGKANSKGIQFLKSADWLKKASGNLSWQWKSKLQSFAVDIPFGTRQVFSVAMLVHQDDQILLIIY